MKQFFKYKNIINYNIRKINNQEIGKLKLSKPKINTKFENTAKYVLLRK